ncbi:MAG: peptide deformylase, partial [Cyanobacteria bacterium]|nr:peptide deformylase [Cyanobacteriota bacterium]MDW8199726.1 peptide deformylase [Cyanobacteriota bacterium SKYGB_h_bin112]
MTRRATILQVGHPLLQQQAAAVADVHNPDIQQLIDDLIATMQAASGVGIAAPQIGQSWQLVIVASRPNARYPHAPVMEPLALINPCI